MLGLPSRGRAFMYYTQARGFLPVFLRIARHFADFCIWCGLRSFTSESLAFRAHSAETRTLWGSVRVATLRCPHGPVAAASMPTPHRPGASAGIATPRLSVMDVWSGLLRRELKRIEEGNLCNVRSAGLDVDLFAGWPTCSSMSMRRCPPSFVIMSRVVACALQCRSCVMATAVGQ